MAHRKTQTVATGYMQMMAEKAAASRTTLGSGSASGSGTASVSTNPTPPLHVGTSSPVQTETPPPSIPAEPDGAFLGPVHPELNVSGHIPYATFRVEDILAQP
ncbi:unnamed protein product [Cochlearia groenlandica]